jgi:REP element-mobilizing transposase RayT
MTSKKPAHPPRIVDPRSTPFAPIKSRGNLPHIFKDGCTYFVTFCLSDVAKTRRAERERLLDERDPATLATKSEPTLDSGACILRHHELATIVEEVLLHFQEEHYLLSAWCVMPNHVHALVTPLESRPLSKILQAWKSVSGHRINRALDQKGPVWQRETFDHLVRNEASFCKFVEYTENNPVAAGLVRRAIDWPFGSARFG